MYTICKGKIKDVAQLLELKNNIPTPISEA
jgi:hypothetical protein